MRSGIAVMRASIDSAPRRRRNGRGARGPATPSLAAHVARRLLASQVFPPSSRGASRAEHAGQPAWFDRVRWLGTPPKLSQRQWTVLGLVSVASFFDQYDTGLFSLALKQIQAEFRIAEQSLGLLSSIVTLGALPALLLAAAADRWGRRRLLVVTIVAYTILTGASAFAPSAAAFVVLQFLARIFITAEYALAVVVLGEELDDDARGWGIGALGALAACGHGLAYALFSLVDVLPLGWRTLYLVGLAPLLLVAWLRRDMAETPHFERLGARPRESRADRRARPRAPVARQASPYRRRFVAMGALYLLLGLTQHAGFFFAPKFLQEAHGFSPAQVSLLGFTGGAVAVFANSLTGRWSDRFGRRPTAIAFLAALPLTIVSFYNAPAMVLPVLWVAMLFFGLGSGVLLSLFSIELFPTAYRSTAAGMRAALGTVGAVIGLSVESALYVLLGSHWAAISALAMLALGAPFVVLCMFPETSGRALDEISPDQ